MTDKRIRVAIAGCGGIARAHAKAYHSNNDLCELVACMDVSSEARDAFAVAFGGTPYESMEALLAEVRPDAISICAPPDSHLPIATLAAERGVAILCEKPLARNLAEAEAMVALVERTGVPFMNALCHRFHGPVLQARDLLQNGTIGRPIHFYNRFAFRFAGVENRWFTRREVAGGGVVLDTAVHSLDIYRFLIGEVANVSARVSITLPIEVEDSATILLQSVDGVTGEISCSWVTPPGESIVRVYGTEGELEIDYTRDPNLRYRTADSGWIDLPYDGPDRFHGEIRHFLKSVTQGVSPSVTVADGARAIALIDAAYRSAGVLG